VFRWALLAYIISAAMIGFAFSAVMIKQQGAMTRQGAPLTRRARAGTSADEEDGLTCCTDVRDE
jgi:hypothetical protein